MSTLSRIHTRLVLYLFCLFPAGLLFAPASVRPPALASADFDGDGKADFAMISPGGRTVRVLLSGAGIAGENRSVLVPVDAPALALAAGDMNGDGQPDLVVATSGYVEVFLSNADATFKDAVKYDPGDVPVSLAVGDFNGDGRGDIVAIGESRQNVIVLLSNSDGTMQAPVRFAFGRMPTAVAAGDFNRDGRLDLVVADAATSQVLLLEGNGDGTFQDLRGYAAGPLPHSLAVGDFNGDGIADVAVAGLGDGKVRVLLGTSNGTLESGRDYEAGVGASSIVVADRDLVWADAANGVLRRLQVGPTVRVLTASSTTLVTSPTGAAIFGQPVMLTATVSPPGATGKVMFYDETTILGVATLAGGQAVFSTQLLASGHRSLRALYRGDATSGASVSAPVALTVTSELSAGFTPASGSPFSVGNHPVGVVVGDLNRDGRTDIATVNGTSGNVTVLLGNGAGGFMQATSFAAGTLPGAIAVGDFNGDGTADLAVLDFSSGTVIVLLGDGSGGFSPAAGSPFPAGDLPFSVAVGDFNGDGNADLAIANVGSNDLTVLLGNGTGGFTAAGGSPITVGKSPDAVVVGDFNGDGRPDLAVANSGANNVTVLLGDGTGKFSVANGSPFAVASNPRSLVVEDFNADGKPDLAIANNDSNNVTILLGNGSGGFAPSAASPLSSNSAQSLATADLNADGKADLIVTNAGGYITTYLGDGNGGFVSNGGSFAAGTGPTFVAVADFNGDGTADLAVAYDLGNNVAVFLGAAGSITTLSAAPNPSTLDQPVTLTASVNPSKASGFVTFYDRTTVLGEAPLISGRTTLVVAGLPSGERLLQARYNGDPAHVGSLSTAVALTVNSKPSAGFISAPASPFLVAGSPRSVAAGDFNRDGTQDLAIVSGSNNLSILLGNGAGAFNAASGSPIGVVGLPTSVAVGDFNADGKPDLAVVSSGGNLTILLGDGSGGLTATPVTYIVGGTPVSVVVADFNGDGLPDLVVANNSSHSVTVMLGDGNGGFKPTGGSPLDVGADPTSVAIGDFNQDGKADLAVTLGIANNNVVILLGDGVGGFTAAHGSPFSAGAAPSSVAVMDFNSDGYPDLAVANFGSNNVSVFLGSGSGGFTEFSGSPFTVGATPTFVAVGEFNGDGNPDLAVANAGSNNVTVFLGNGNGGFTAARRSPFATGVSAASLAIADFNGDGRADVAVVNSGSNNVTVLLGIKPTPGDFDANGVPDVALQFPDGSIGTWLLGETGRQLPILGFSFLAGPSSGISLVDVADLNGDGFPDLILQFADNSIGVWYMGGAQGTTITSFALISAPIPGWKPVAVADLNRDGHLDLVIQNTNGSIGVWFLGGTMGNQIQGFAPISGPLTGWRLAGMADIDNDGHPDAVIQNSNGSIGVWHLGGAQGNQIQDFAVIAGPSSWSVTATTDLDGDGHPDLMIRNLDGTLGVWYLGGTQGNQITGFTPITGPGGANWNVLGVH